MSDAKAAQQAAADRRYRLRHPERHRRAYQAWAARNHDRIRTCCRLRRKLNPDEIRYRDRERYAKNKARRLANNRKSRAIHGHKYRKKDQARITLRRRTDPSFRLKGHLSSRINKVLRGKSKSAKTVALLGCSIESFWLYLESRFEPGMTRENYGPVWHVDHIMPCAIFDLSKPEHQRRCFHFSNLQPLFAEDNIKKGSKITTGGQFNLL